MNISGVKHLDRGMQRVENLERKALQDLQDVFAKTNHIYMFCYDALSGEVTDIHADEDEMAYLRKHFLSHKDALVRQFRDGDIENVIDAPMEESHLMMRGLSLRGEKRKLVGVWVMMAIDGNALSEDTYLSNAYRKTTRAQFDEATELLETLTERYMEEMIRKDRLSDDLGQVENSGRKTEALLKKSEALTEILKSLEEEGDFIHVAKKILEQVTEFYGISNASILRLNSDHETVDMIIECSKSRESLMNDFHHVAISDLPFFTGRPYTISSSMDAPKEFQRFLNKYDVMSGVFLPIKVSEQNGMYVCFLVHEEERRWTMDEVKFLNDVKCVLQTVLVKRITKNSLASSYSTLESILENTGCGIAVVDSRKRLLLYTNGTYKEMVRNEVDSSTLEMLLLDTKETETKHLEYHSVASDFWYDLSFENIHWVDGRSVRLCTLYDISEMKQYQKRIERQANMDYLTGLYNRKRCELDLDIEIRNAKRESAEGALLYIDLDDFKNINDGLGHTVGDALLVAVADEFQKITGVSVKAYRAGGDEFALIIPASENQRIEKIVNRIMDAFATPWNLEDQEYYCTMSMGAVYFPKDGEDVTTLMQRADFALRDAKHHGKNHVEFYSEKTGERAIQRLDMERALRSAVEQDCSEFLVYYQPIVDASQPGHPCRGAEALVRWQSKDLGFVMPGDFVPLAEYLGLIVPIGQHVLLEACKRCKFWNDYGHPEYKIHVNLSVIQLIRDDIVLTVQDALESTGLMPSNLTLEVTEGLAVQDMEAMNRILAELKKMGVRVALDDFGTGYSSLSYMRDMPLDTIKIDKSFIDDVGQDDFSDAFVKTVSSLAEAIDVDVVVEGVEDQKQTEALREMKVDLIQGYYYDKPLPQDKFEEKYCIETSYKL